MENRWPSTGTFIPFEVLKYFSGQKFTNQTCIVFKQTQKNFLLLELSENTICSFQLYWEWEGTRVKYLLLHWQFPTIRKMGGIEKALHMQNVQNLDILN